MTSSAKRQRPQNSEQFNDPSELRIQEAMELFLLELEQGTTPNIDDFLKTHIGLEEELREHLEGLVILHQAAKSKNGWSPTPQSEDVVPTLDEYRILRTIGHGGMGTVYEAVQLSDNQSVAIKVLHFRTRPNQQEIQRFRNEGTITLHLDHPNIVRVRKVGYQQGIHFHVLDLVEGKNLADWISEARRSISNGSVDQSIDDQQDQRIRKVARFGVQIANALEFAHKMSVLHRDVKPANVIINSKGQALLTDFGLAKFKESDLTMSGDVIGTLNYMSPEQTVGNHAIIDRRSDIYSLGATLFEAASLSLPSTKVKTGSVNPKNDKRIAIQVTHDFETILLKAMSPEMECRYQTAQELADDIERFLQNRRIRGRRKNYLDRLGIWIAKHKKTAAGIIATFVVLIVCLFITSMLAFRAQRETQVALSNSQAHSQHVEELLYLADIQRAYDAWNRHQRYQAVQILQSHRPNNDEGAGRLEWRLLNALVSEPDSQIVGKHSASINDLAVFPGKPFVATVGDDGLLRIWDVKLRKMLTSIDTGEPELNAVAVAPDGKFVVTGGFRVQLWNIETGARQELTRHESHVESIAFSPDGTRILTGSRYDVVRLITTDGTLIREIADESRHESLAFAGDGKRILVPSRKPLKDGGHEGFIRVWSNDMKVVDRDFVVDDPERKVPNYTLATATDDGSILALSERYQRIHTKLFDAATGEMLTALPPYRDQINASAFSNDGRWFAAAFNDGTVAYWKLYASQTQRWIHPQRTYSLKAHQGKATAVAFVGNTQLVCAGTDGLLRSFALASHDFARLIGPGVKDLAMSRDHRNLAIAGEQRLLVTDLQGNTIHKIESPDFHFHHVAISSDDRLLASACFRRGVIEIRDLEAMTLVHQFKVEHRVCAVEFSPQRDELAAILSSGEIVLYDTNNFVKKKVMVADPDFVASNFCGRYSKDGSKFVCGGQISEFLEFDLVTGDIIRRLPMDLEPHSFDFNSEGTMLASGHSNGAIRLIDWPSGNVVHEFSDHQGRVSDLKFSSDDRTLLSISNDGTTRLWSVNHSRELGILCRRSDAGEALCISSDDNHIIAGYAAAKSKLPGVHVFTLKN